METFNGVEAATRGQYIDALTTEPWLRGKLLEFAEMPEWAFEPQAEQAPAPDDDTPIPITGDCLAGVIPDAKELRLLPGAPIIPGDVVVVVTDAALQPLVKVFVGLEGANARLWAARPDCVMSVPLTAIRHVVKADVVPMLPAKITAGIQDYEWADPPKQASVARSYNNLILDTVEKLRDMPAGVRITARCGGEVRQAFDTLRRHSPSLCETAISL